MGVFSEALSAGLQEVFLGIGRALLVVLFLGIMLAIVYHFFFSFMLWKLAKELDVKHRWLSWIPLVNLNIVFMCGNVNPFWTLLVILMLIPALREIIAFVLTVLFIIAFWNIAKKRGYPAATALLVWFPLFNVILLILYTFFPQRRKHKKHTR